MRFRLHLPHRRGDRPIQCPRLCKRRREITTICTVLPQRRHVLQARRMAMAELAQIEDEINDEMEVDMFEAPPQS